MKVLGLLITILITNASYSSVSEEIITSIKDTPGLDLEHLKIEAGDSSDYLIFATRDMQKKPKVIYSKENFKNYEISELESLLLFCHEIGHFKGGAPFKKRGRSQKLSWSSAEGQADYFSTLVCLKEFDISKLSYRSVEDKKVNNEILNLCNDFNCIKTLSAIYHVVKTYQKFTNSHQELSFYEVNTLPPYDTILDYPSPQCRLTTIARGYFCKEANSEKTDCAYREFARPDCWFIQF
jgi:hypothetical protein